MRTSLLLLGVLVLLVTSCHAGEKSVRIRPEDLPPDARYPHAMTIRISPPWEQQGEWALRSPETIGSNHGLLFIDHHRPDMVPVTKPIGDLRWQSKPDGTLWYACELDYGIRFSVFMKPGKNDVSIVSILTNHFRHDLSNMGNQYCLMHTGVKGFEDPKAERTYIPVNGKFVPLAETHPGFKVGTPQGSKPFFIVTNTRDLAPLDKVDIDRSWWCDEQADVPLIATVSEDGKRIVALGFDNSYKIMTNAEIPCIHADPMFADCKREERVMVRGKIYFVEGKLDDLLPLFYRDFPEWKGRPAWSGANGK